MPPDAAEHLLHVDAIAAVHPRGDELITSPGVAGVVAHPVVAGPVCPWVGEGPGQLPVGADAWRTLKFLEAEDARFDVEAERRAVDEALEKLRSVGPTIQRLKDSPKPK